MEAAEYYVALLPWSAIDAVLAQGNPDDPMIVEFTLHGAPMMIMSGGPPYKLSPAASISVLTKDQDETDRLWSALVSDGGAAVRCGSPRAGRQLGLDVAAALGMAAVEEVTTTSSRSGSCSRLDAAKPSMIEMSRLARYSDMGG